MDGLRPRCYQKVCQENWTPPSPWQATVFNRCPDLYAFSIRPSIEYGSIVWSGLSSSDAAHLERFNRSAARLITKTSPSSDISRELLLARAGLQSLGTRHRMAQCILIRKAYLGRRPRHLQRALSPWISPGKRRQSPRTSPLSIHVQRPNKSSFQRSTGHSFKQPPPGTDLLSLQPAETSLRHVTFQTFLTNNSVQMRFNIFFSYPNINVKL